MFNLNENNRIVISQQPTDMRKGVNTLCGQVRMLGLDPADGKVYIFVGSSRKVMKISIGSTAATLCTTSVLSRSVSIRAFSFVRVTASARCPGQS